MTYVTMHQTNSGGYWWLSDDAFNALVADGWRPIEDHRSGATRNLALDVPVDNPQHAVTIAKIEFTRVTGKDADTVGCTCCGVPFRFDDVEYDADYPEEFEEIERLFVPTAEAVEITDVLLLESGE